MSDWFAKELTTLAFCWRLDRRDGVALGFTSHDRDLVMGVFLFRAAPGMVPSALEQSTGLEADAVSLAGAIISDGLSEADLAAGRWDGARLWLWAIDWSAPDESPRQILSGELGTVESDGRSFSVDLVGPKSAFDAPVAEATSPHCRARLGDKRCRVDMAGRTRLARIGEANGRVLTLVDALPVLDARLVRRAESEPAPGDLLLMRAGPAQLHLAIWSGAGFVHAHAGLRRVVETPGVPPWPFIGVWFSRKDG